MESAKKKVERQKTKLLGKIIALDADDDLYDIMYEDLQRLLREHTKNISELDARINQLSIAIQNADSQAATAEEIYGVMRTVVEFMDIMPAEDERKIMQMLLESVQVYPERQPNGLLVKRVRFRIPLEYKGTSVQDIVLEVDQDTDNFLPDESSVESIVLLSKLKSNKLKHINVELEMDELDLTAAESKVTYEVIKDYVLKQSGLKVSNLYIAQIKQKCGIIERTNYNLPKSENSRQPQCPAEKEQAIVAALKHFGIV